MPTLLWDASALVKRYAREVGSATVHALFAEAPRVAMVTTFWSYTETFAGLLRKRNRGSISTSLFRSSALRLRTEVLYSPGWQLLTIQDSAVLGGVPLIEKHSLNTADAILIETWLAYTRSLPLGAPAVLVAADARFLRAADAEGLTTLNPEVVAAADVPALLAGL